MGSFALWILLHATYRKISPVPVHYEITSSLDPGHSCMCPSQRILFRLMANDRVSRHRWALRRTTDLSHWQVGRSLVKWSRRPLSNCMRYNGQSIPCKTFYKHMVDESGRLDHTRAAFALNKTMESVKIPFDQRILYTVSISVPSF